jgi:alkanesulfonate monooxygenase SsuD/methylene tetrahydromethanopterin reductase-like flavin-dependent oxidoreductase (luciferase family)
VVFVPLYALGLLEMTRRLQHYDVALWHQWVMTAVFGILIMACAAACQALQFFVSIRRHHQLRDQTGDPWDGRSLEWATLSPPPPSEGGRTFHRVLYDMARRQNMTLRDLYNLTAAARGHWVICGTPTGIADTLEEWFVAGAADGYNILPAYFPGAFADFVDLVVPELQHRGLFRRDYAGQTLRDHLGLPRAGPARLRQAARAE